MPGITLTVLSNWIITLGAIAGALAAVWKIFSPLTSLGKKQIQKRQEKRNEEIKGIAEAMAESHALEVKESMADMDKKLENINQNFQQIVYINAEQTKSIEALDMKINDNEKDRLRWEILHFAEELRTGIEPSKEEYEHIIRAHEKYERIMTELGQPNGVIDSNYAVIQRRYQEFLAQQKI